MVNYYVRPITQFNGKIIWLVCRIHKHIVIGQEDSEQEALEHAARVAAHDVALGKTIQIRVQSLEGERRRKV